MEPLEAPKYIQGEHTVVSLQTDSIVCGGVEIKEHESLLYATGTLPRPENFMFSKEMIRIDWRALAGVDIERLVWHCVICIALPVSANVESIEGVL